MKWPNEEVSEMGAKHAPGLYKLKVSEQVDDTDRSGCAVILVNCRIGAPASMKNQPFQLRFRVGVTQVQADGLNIESGEDLDAENDETWKGNPSARAYKSYLKALGVVSTGDTDEEAEDAKGKVFFVQLGEKKGYENYDRFYSDGEAPEDVSAPVTTAKKDGLKKTRKVSTVEDEPAPKGKGKAKEGLPSEDDSGEDW